MDELRYASEKQLSHGLSDSFVWGMVGPLGGSTEIHIPSFLRLHIGTAGVVLLSADGEAFLVVWGGYPLYFLILLPRFLVAASLPA